MYTKPRRYYKLKRFILLLLYKALLEIIYIKFGSPIYSYMGLTYEPNTQKFIISYVLFMIMAFLPGFKRECVSKYMIDVFFMFTVIPLLSIFWQQNRETNYVIMVAISYVLLNGICIAPNNKKTVDIKIAGINHINILWVLFFLSVFLMIGFTWKFGFADFRALSMENIYEVRAEREYTGIWAYLYRWITGAILPCMLCIALNKRKKYCIVIAALLQFYMFLHTGAKGTLFAIGLMIFSFYFIKREWSFTNWWARILIFISLISTSMYYFFGSKTLFSIFPVRLSYIPAITSFDHYDFFSNHRKLYFCENFIGRILGLKSPYDKFSTFLVSGTDANANTGFIADAYDNAGFPCVLIYTLILALLLRLVDRLCENSGKDALPAYVAIMTNVMLLLNDGSLTAAFLTGGVFIILLIFYKYNELTQDFSIEMLTR